VAVCTSVVKSHSGYKVQLQVMSFKVVCGWLYTILL